MRCACHRYAGVLVLGGGKWKGGEMGEFLLLLGLLVVFLVDPV